MYKSLIRSVIDYGSIIYDSAETNITCKLDKLQNQCLRTCCGALKSTPISAIQNDCGILPLNLQRKSLQLKYISKVYIEKDNPNASLLEKDWQYYYGKFKSNNVPIARKVEKFFSNLNEPIITHKTLPFPSWHLPVIIVDTSLQHIGKKKS